MALELSQRIGTTLWVHKDGRTFTVELDEGKSKARRTSTTGQTSDGILRSPMPGKVLKINHQVGAQVKAGETVCVLEAMKMEYALKAPFDGKIKSIFKKAGEQVTLDEKIAEITK